MIIKFKSHSGNTFLHSWPKQEQTFAYLKLRVTCAPPERVPFYLSIQCCAVGLLCAVRRAVIGQGAIGSIAMLQHVRWLITLWLCVSRACQPHRPHEVRGTSADVWGRPGVTAAHSSRQDSQQRLHLNLTSPPFPPLAFTSRVPADSTWTKSCMFLLLDT